MKKKWLETVRGELLNVAYINRIQVESGENGSFFVMAQSCGQWFLLSEAYQERQQAVIRLKSYQLSLEHDH